MKTAISLLVAVVFIVALSSPLRAANADDILGTWLNEEKDAQIEIFKCRELYCGKIVWLKEPNYSDGSKDGIPGTPKTDHHNPDTALRKFPIIGLEIVHDFVYAGDDLWKEGRVYDPKNGRTYKGKMTLVSPHQLNLRGFIGISLIGRTTTWTR